MAGTFRIFNEKENILSSKKNKQKSYTVASSKVKSVGSSGIQPVKLFAYPQNKPKGLSIRSLSDLNVSALNIRSTNLNSNEFTKLQNNQCMSNKSPNKLKTPKSKSHTNIATKTLSPKILSPITQNVADEFVFRKPATPKEQKKILKYPEPENLSNHYDYYKYLIEEMDNIFEEERTWLRSLRKPDDSISSNEDEGFISDPELDSSDIYNQTIASLSTLRDVELPEISDCED